MFGVDTASVLSSINWGAFFAWKGVYPSFAGRYFGGGYNWSPGEGRNAKQTTGGVLRLILPIQASADSIIAHQETAGTDGYNYGSDDANATCAGIVAAINSGELSAPSSGEVNVFCDVEATTNLTADYWAGWANAVYYYPLGAAHPFFPSMYCQFAAPSGQYVPNNNIQTVLNDVCGMYPSKEVRCFSFWSSEPEYPCVEYCSTDPCLDWTLFGTYSQPCGSTSYRVPLHVWQFAETIVCNPCSGITNYAGGQNLDQDDTDNTDAPQYMLLIN